MPSSKWRSERSGPNWLMDEQGRLIGYRDELGNEYKMPNEPAAGGISDNDEPSSSVSGGGNVRDFIDLQQASAELFNADTVVPLTVAKGATITLESPLRVNHATLDLDLNGTTMEAGNIDGNYKALTVGNSFLDYSGYRKYDFSRPFLRNGTIKGRGPSANFASLIRNGKGTAGLYFNGTRGTPNKVIRPTTENLVITGFDTGIDGKTGFFLGNFSRTVVYDCALGFRQRRGLDAGERIVFSNRCLMQRVRLAFLLEDDSSELHYDGSLDYLMQWLLADPVTGWCRATFDIHYETYYTNSLNDPIWYVAQGRGNDDRLICPWRDSPVDVNGDGSAVFIRAGSSLDHNTNNLEVPIVGTTPSATHDHFIHLRNRNSWGVIDKVSAQNLNNISNTLKRGPGKLMREFAAPAFPSLLTLPSKISNNPMDNMFASPAINDLSSDLVSITHDGKEITDRLTGLNLTLTRDNTVRPGGQGDGTVGAVTLSVDPATQITTYITAIAPISGNSCVLTEPWAYPTGTYTLTFSNGATRTVTLNNDSSAVSWGGGGVVADADIDVSGGIPSVQPANGSVPADGTYRVVFYGDAAGTFWLETANYECLGVGVAGTPFATRGFAFTVTAGSIPFGPYDTVDITVAGGVATRNGSPAGKPSPSGASLKVTKNAQTALTFTGALSAATSGNLSAAWTGATGTYALTFSDNSVRSAVLTNGSAAVTWTGGAVTATASATIRNDAKWSWILPVQKGRMVSFEILSMVPSVGGASGPVSLAYRFVKLGTPKVGALAATATDGAVRAGHSQLVPSFGAPDTGAAGGFDLGFSRSGGDVRLVTIDSSAGNLDRWTINKLTIGNPSVSTSDMVCPDWADAVQVIGGHDNAVSGAVYFARPNGAQL